MARTISETIYSKSFSLSEEHPIAFALGLRETASRYGKLNVLEDSVSTSISGKKISMSFEIIVNIDNVTESVVFINVLGEDRAMSVFMRGSAKTVLNKGEEIFNDFYMKELRKETMPYARSIITRISGIIENYMRNH